MQRLLDFIKYIRYFLLFLLLEAVAFALVSAQYDYHKGLLAGLTGDVGYSMTELTGGWTRYFSLGEENTRLAAENARLRTMLSADDKYTRLAAENARLRTMLSADDKYAQMDLLAPADSFPYAYTAASVVKNSFRSSKNYIVLDRGALDGVEKDQGVVTEDGVLGVIVQVTPHYSVCRSLLHADSYVSAKFRKNDFFGTVDWDGQDPHFVNLINIPRHADVAIGDSVVTDRRSTLFPEGLLIGTVAQAEVTPESDLYNIRVRLSDDLTALRRVYILKYRYKDELKQVLDYE